MYCTNVSSSNFSSSVLADVALSCKLDALDLLTSRFIFPLGEEAESLERENHALKWACSSLHENRGVAKSKMAFAGQVAIVTGGAQGLGLAIARMLVSNGATVVVFDMDTAKGYRTTVELQTEGDAKFFQVLYCSFSQPFVLLQVDVSSEISVKEGFESFKRQFDRLDIMVNCAGIVGPSSIKTEDIPVAEWDKVQQGKSYRHYLSHRLTMTQLMFAVVS